MKYIIRITEDLRTASMIPSPFHGHLSKVGPTYHVFYDKDFACAHSDPLHDKFALAQKALNHLKQLEVDLEEDWPQHETDEERLAFAIRGEQSGHEFFYRNIWSYTMMMKIGVPLQAMFLYQEGCINAANEPALERVGKVVNLSEMPDLNSCCTILSLENVVFGIGKAIGDVFQWSALRSSEKFTIPIAEFSKRFGPFMVVDLEHKIDSVKLSARMRAHLLNYLSTHRSIESRVSESMPADKSIFFIRGFEANFWSF